MGRSHDRRFCAIFACLLSLSSVSFSQAAISNTPISRKLLISLRSKEKIEELNPPDFEVKEGGTRSPVQRVQRLARPPLRYCVLFDVSGSEHDQFSAQQEIAIRTIRSAVLPKIDLGWLITFSHDRNESKETDDPENIVSAINAARSLGGTALYDAIAQCSDRMKRSTENARLPVMFLFSDGDDNASQMSNGEAIDKVKRSGIRIYSFAPEVRYGSQRAKGIKVLERLSEVTGGQFFTTGRASKADKIGAEVSEDMRNIYVISYMANSSRNEHRIEIKCTKRDVRVVSYVLMPATD